MDNKTLKTLIKIKRKSAVDDLIRETKQGHSHKYWELKGTIDAYTDIIALLERYEDEVDRA